MKQDTFWDNVDVWTYRLGAISIMGLFLIGLSAVVRPPVTRTTEKPIVITIYPRSTKDADEMVRKFRKGLPGFSDMKGVVIK